MDRVQILLIGFVLGFLSASTFSLIYGHTNKPQVEFNIAPFKPLRRSSLATNYTGLVPNTKVVVNTSTSNLLVEVIQKERRSTLDEACMRFFPQQACQTSEIYVHDRNLYSKKYKASFCDIYKCGYTSWLGAVFVMEDIYSVQDFKDGKISGEDVMVLADKFRMFSIVDEKVRRQVWKNSLKVILVRHPFSRIVSAYNDKIATLRKEYNSMYWDLSNKIIEKYRHLRQNVTQRNKTDDGTATFEDFVNFLVRADNDKCDVHWKSFQGTCQPCKSQYDYIAKFESLENDMEYLRHKLNLSEYHQEAFFPPRKFKSNVDLVEKTFEKIPKKLSYQLYEKYKMDFEMFGYRKPKWLC